MKFVNIGEMLINPDNVCCMDIEFDKNDNELNLCVYYVGSEEGPARYTLLSLYDLDRWDDLEDSGKTIIFAYHLKTKFTELLKVRFPCFDIHIMIKDMAEHELNTYLQGLDQK